MHGDPGGQSESSATDGEERLRERIAHLEQALKERDEFLSIAAHELRNPMHSLLLQVSAALIAARLEGSAALVKRLERVQQIVDRYVKRASLLLDVGRMNATQRRVHVEDVDLAEVVREVCESYAAEAEFHRSVINMQAPDCLAGRWDRLGVEQIISNLISNAIKFGAGAPIELTLTPAESGWVRLEVRDHGVGIAQEDQMRIFGRFEQLPSRGHGGGAGLGLWLVRGLVEAHGGEIEVRSEPGQGALFVILLPRDAASEGLQVT